MSPGKLIAEPSFTVTDLPKSAKDKTNYGAVIEGVDLNNVNDADVKHLADAIWTHKVVVVKGQQNLEPIKQWELVTRWDPEAPQVHSHGDLNTYKNKGGVLTVSLVQSPQIDTYS